MSKIFVIIKFVNIVIILWRGTVTKNENVLTYMANCYFCHRLGNYLSSQICGNGRSVQKTFYTGQSDMKARKEMEKKWGNEQVYITT